MKGKKVSDITSRRVLYLKGGLFLMLGVMACVLILIQVPDLLIAALLGLAIWAFCRAYYFAFYVIEQYIDAEYRFAGLISFCRYVMSRRRAASQTDG